MTPKAKSLKKTIDNLSSKKHTVSATALNAKKAVEKQKSEAFEPEILSDDSKDFSKELSKDFRKQVLITEEFSQSVKLLVSIFNESNFDEMVMIVANPSRVLVLNFFIGIIRGLGFAVGLMLIMFFVAYFVQDMLPVTFYQFWVMLFESIQR
ncbi:MAG: hypothetical protein ACI9BD_001584 [Candidatus Marinamargulisbacteria bacterium]|jgi:hypothetical protein